MMNNYRLFILPGILMISAALNAQKPIKVLEDSIPIGNYLYPGFNVTIPETNFDNTLKNWVKMQESGTKSKVQTENGEMTIFGAIIKEISAAPVNVYSRLMNEDTLNRLLVTIELKKDQYIEPASGEVQLTAARNYLKEFAKSQYMDVVKEQLSAQEKILRDMENELSSLENRKKRTLKTAENKRSTVNDEQSALSVKQNELGLVSTEISNKNREMIAMRVGPERDAMSAQISELEKRRKKLQNEISSSENKISKAKSDINEANNEVPVNENEQYEIRAKIDTQQAVVQSYVEKLNNVKRY